MPFMDKVAHEHAKLARQYEDQQFDIEVFATKCWEAIDTLDNDNSMYKDGAHFYTMNHFFRNLIVNFDTPQFKEHIYDEEIIDFAIWQINNINVKCINWSVPFYLMYISERLWFDPKRKREVEGILEALTKYLVEARDA